MRGLGSLFRQRASRYWWMQYYVRGKRRRESTGCERFKSAQDVLRKKIIEIQRQASNDDGSSSTPCTVAGLYGAIECDYVTNGRKSLPHLKSLWENHLSKFFAPIAAPELSSNRIAEYVRQRQTAGAANASINRELAALKRMCKLALKAGKLNVVPYVQMLQERNVRKGFVRDAQYDALARETAKVGLWLRSMFELAYCYGWRKSELAGMRVSQVDLVARTIELNPGETKNDHGRVVVVTSKAWELLSACIAGKAAEDLVFTRPDRSAVGNFRRAWARACREAGVPDLLFHDLRRSAVRNMRRNGITESVAMRISGHRTRSVFERYNIVDEADLKEAAARIERGAQQRAEGEAARSRSLGNAD